MAVTLRRVAAGLVIDARSAHSIERARAREVGDRRESRDDVLDRLVRRYAFAEERYKEEREERGEADEDPRITARH